MRMILSDARHGMRLMARSPGFTAIAVLALALGIGANTAIFSVVNAVLLHPLTVSEPDRIVTFHHYHEGRKLTSGGSAYADVCDWRRQLSSFESIEALQTSQLSLSTGGDPERVRLGKVTAGFFPMLGVAPSLGRNFRTEEDLPGAGRVVVLSHELWQRRFAGNPNISGSTAFLDGDPYTVIGVLPASFRFIGPRMDVFAPLAASDARGGRPVGVTAYGRLKRGVGPEQLEAELDAATEALDQIVPRHKGWKIRTAGLSEWIVPDVRTSLLVLLAAVALVLMIACTNVANLLMSRAAVRRRELAVRTALGAGRRRLIGQLLAENTPLALLGASLGLLLAWWGVQLVKMMPVSRIPRLDETAVDGSVLAFTAAVSLITFVLFALAPAVSLSRADVHDALKEGGRSGTGTRGSRTRSALVTIEVGLALLLLITATLLIRSFYRLSAVDPGFRPDSLLTASIDLPRHRYGSREEILRFYERTMERVSVLPGVKAASLTNSLPLGGNYFRSDFRLQGREYPTPGDIPILNFRDVDSNYLRTFQIPLRRGRFFTQEDHDGAPRVIVINETTARRFFGDTDPIGQRVGSPNEYMTIIGVVADVKHTDVSLGPDTEVLQPLAQKPAPGFSIAVRVDGKMYEDPMRLAPVLRRAIGELDKNLALAQIASMEKIMTDRLAPRRLSMVLLSGFAGVALLLAAAGIYGVLSFAVQRRTHEIGVRMALGASESEVVSLIVRQALAPAGAGIVIGLAAAGAFTRVLDSLLYNVSATDPLIFGGAALVLAMVAAAASYIPARRAIRVNPIEALRYE